MQCQTFRNPLSGGSITYDREEGCIVERERGCVIGALLGVPLDMLQGQHRGGGVQEES